MKEMNREELEKLLTYLSKDMMEKILHRDYPVHDVPLKSMFAVDALNLLLYIYEYCWGKQESQRVHSIMSDVLSGKRKAPSNKYQEMN